jgi:2-keto-4-pentenoate hydratase/2-oxohepta-3-ene-1,7-dioic acid hydratase in catechol pathway
MRLANIKRDGGAVPAAAVVRGDGTLLEVGAALRAHAALRGQEPGLPTGVTPMEIIGRLSEYRAALSQAEEALTRAGRLAEFTRPVDTPLASPIPRPNRILAIGRNYAEHARELGNAVPDDPIVFQKASTCVVGPDEAIEMPAWVGRVDYEGELLVVLGSGGKNIAEADAMGLVAAYSVFNDVTARERQRAAQEKKHPWFLAKSMDTFGPLGPHLVTADQIADPHALRVTLSVNGETRQDDTTGSMIYRIPTLIAFLSRWMRLEAGDVIATGTPSGVGPLTPGDVVEVTVEGVGTLRNPVVSVD